MVDLFENSLARASVVDYQQNLRILKLSIGKPACSA
ncbi:MAG: hypothetical protein H6Q04_1365 [Acidobacteria bacterium]|nr:hypothetical protein [Acidobacteriota bacterium]